jgi:hypothetical protein
VLEHGDAPFAFHCRERRLRAFDLHQLQGCLSAYDGRMFKNILIPTDGSRLAAKGIKAGV